MICNCVVKENSGGCHVRCNTSFCEFNAKTQLPWTSRRLLLQFSASFRSLLSRGPDKPFWPFASQHLFSLCPLEKGNRFEDFLRFASMWIRTARPPCRLPKGWQVSHQRWIWGFHCTQVTKWGDPPWLWNPGQTSPDVQNRVSVAPQKALMSYNFFSKNRKDCLW